MFANLVLKRNNAVTLLADEERLRSHVPVPSGYLTKLNSAASEYEQAVAIILATLEPDSNQRVVYTTKLSWHSWILLRIDFMTRLTVLNKQKIRPLKL